MTSSGHLGDAWRLSGNHPDIAMASQEQEKRETIDAISRGEERTLTDSAFIAGIDIDGQLRGKFVPGHKTKGSQIPFCSVVYGWDCNDEQYTNGHGTVADPDTGYGDLKLHLDWRHQYYLPRRYRHTEFILGYFTNEGSNVPLYSDPRSLIRRVLGSSQYSAKAGAEIEFFNFNESEQQIQAAHPDKLTPITTGMNGYSASVPVDTQSYWDAIIEASSDFGIRFDTWHSESGPGVMECALSYTDAELMADQVTLFKYAARTATSITPCFMAKPRAGMPGNSGHLHCSLWTKEEEPTSVFAATEPTSVFPETKWLSMEGHYFLAGLIEALPHIMLMFAPNVNSYKRLDPSFWAPVTISWGSDNRLSAVRLIDCFQNSKSCRFEVRIPGADMIPHFAIAAIFGAGYRGIKNKTELKLPPVKTKQDITNSELLPHTLADSIHRFEAKDSIARELFGNEFVDHYAGTRKHELNLYNKQISEWEFKRYIGTA